MGPENTSGKLSLYMHHRAGLIDYAASILGDRVLAEDVVQEAWVRFSRAGKPATGLSLVFKPESYLYRIVRNLAIDLSRSRARDNWTGEAAMSDLEDATARVDEAVAARDELRALERALAELPDRQRRAFEMRRMQDMPYAEIARILGISQTRAHDLVRQAYAHCAGRLMDEGY